MGKHTRCAAGDGGISAQRKVPPAAVQGEMPAGEKRAAEENPSRPMNIDQARRGEAEDRRQEVSSRCCSCSRSAIMAMNSLLVGLPLAEFTV